MLSPLFDETIDLINRWQLKHHYLYENQYRNDLLEYLRKKFDEQNPFSSPRKISIRKEDGSELCDIAIDERTIGIEMKMDLVVKEDVDKLSGQLLSYKKQYNDLIVVLVGMIDDEAFEYLKQQISGLQDNNIMNQQRIRIIKKEHLNEANEQLGQNEKEETFIERYNRMMREKRFHI
jgi:hypothetical protein